MRSLLLAATLLLSTLPATADPRPGIDAFGQGRYADALDLLQSAPSDPTARFFEGAALYKLHRPEDALDAITDAFARDPALAGEVGRLYEGLAEYDLKLYRAARAAFVRVTELNPTGRLAAVARQHLGALDALRGNPTSAAGWYLDRGLAFAAAARPRLAAAFLAEARAVDPSVHPELVGLHLAAALNALGRPEEALAAVGTLAGAGPAVQRGRALAALGRNAEAARELKSALSSGEHPWTEAARALLAGTR